MTRYIYPTHESRDGRLVVGCSAIGHIEVAGRIICDAAVPEQRKASQHPLPGRRVCGDCKAAYYPAPVKAVSAHERQRQAELDKWERLTGVRPGR